MDNDNKLYIANQQSLNLIKVVDLSLKSNIIVP